MHSRAPVMASPKLIESEAWQEPLRDTTLKHRRFIWATQFGCGSTGSNTKRDTIAGKLAENVAPSLIKTREEARRLHNTRGHRMLISLEEARS